MLTFVAFIFVIGVLIIVHEWGHFIVAKKMGVRVDEFSIGFPPKMLTLFRRNGTDYILSWMPFGGYVKMAGMEFDESTMAGNKPDERSDTEKEMDPELFSSKTAGQRFWIIFAGPAMNFIFAFILFIGILFVDGVPYPAHTAIEVDPGSSAERAGLQTGDRVLAVNGQSVKNWLEITQLLDPEVHPDGEITVMRGSRELVVTYQLPEATGFGIFPFYIPLIGTVQKDSPAYHAGLQAGDLITTIHWESSEDFFLHAKKRRDTLTNMQTKSIAKWEEMANVIRTHADVPLWIHAIRGDSLLTTIATPSPGQVPAGENRLQKVGLIGVKMHLEKERISLPAAVLRSGQITAQYSFLILNVFRTILQGNVNRDMVGGPVAIGKFAGEVARWGFIPLLNFMAVLSIQLAILNLILPIPVLDGAQIAFIAIEKLRGRPVSAENRMRLAQVGAILLITLMVVVTILDITR
ncbi:MAG: RIP metalloprotease RseP [Candidatus Cloacimonetes bacterium 4572_55]|nr:MAG: RIP metalloprotease RseP [Candidatus Cloacimonetes bacterium 4572_55]